MGRHKTAKPGDWTTVRVRPEWLDMLRAAGQKNPSFSPTVDLTTASAPKLLHLACQVAALHISGWFWDRLTPDLDQIVDLARLQAAVQVAAFFGAEVQKNADQSLTIIARGKTDYTIPKSQNASFPKPMFH